MANAQYTCVVCPVSCLVTVTETPQGLAVSGNQCKRGERHAIAEHTEPLRMLTTTVAIRGGTLPRIPVISTQEIPRAKLRACLAALYKLRVTAPIRCGDVLVADICGTGVDVVAARSMQKQ